MIIFLYGSDTYRSRQKLNEIIAHYKKIHESGLNLKYFDCQKLDSQGFKDEIQQTPMFKEKKLVILTNAFLNPEFKEKFLKGKKSFVDSEDIILFYETSQILKNNSLFVFLKKYAKSQEFENLEGQKLKNWLKKEFEKYQTEINQEALEELINFVGGDTWQLSNEVKKLVNYKAKKRVEIKDIELLVKPKIESDIFKTIDAIASKNKKQALFLIHKHLEKGDSPLFLLSMINFQFRNLLMIKSKKFGYEKTGLHPFVVRKTTEQAKNFTLEELKKIYQRIFQADLAIKTGKIEPEAALDMLIAEI